MHFPVVSGRVVRVSFGTAPRVDANTAKCVEGPSVTVGGP